MEDSILISIKKLLGVSENNSDFDTDIIMHINSVLMILNQLGVGKNNFIIKDEKSKWADFLGDDVNELTAVVSYIHLRVRLLFDPPLNSAIIESMNESIKELEWRLNVKVETNEEAI